MTHDVPLATSVAIYKRVRDAIAADAGLDPDDEAVLDTADGETDLADILVRILRASRWAAAEAKGAGELIKQMAERKARKEAKAERLKAIVLHAMADAGLPKLAAPDFSVSRGRAPDKVIVTADPTMLPDAMCRISREPDKVAIKAFLKGGAQVDWATLSNGGETLVVRAI